MYIQDKDVGILLFYIETPTNSTVDQLVQEVVSSAFGDHTYRFQ